MYKSQLLEKYSELTPKQLCQLLNVEFFEELTILGYKKTMKQLPPKIVRKFIELYGKPIEESEFKEY